MPDDAPDTSVGELAVQQGWITPRQLEEALAAQSRDESDGRPRRPLGAILVARKIIAAQQLAALLRVQQKLRNDGEAFPEDVQSASLLSENWFGKYVRVEPIGTGGMADVWRAWDPELRRWVALKVLRGRSTSDTHRFLNEARAAARLAHPGIVPVFDFGEEGGQRFIAMPWIKGRTLDGMRPDPREACRIVRDAARAVAAAHAAGVLHRDLKPQNILLGEDGAVFVTDFGLAREIHSDSGVTLPGTILGTPHYASPEQLDARPADARSDVYSLGTTLYEALTGVPPFDAPTLTELIRVALNREPTPPRNLKPDIPVDAQWICMKAMAKDPARRYADADALAADLLRFLDGEPILARKPSLIYRTRRAFARRPALRVAVAATVLALVAGAWAWTEFRRREEATVLLAAARETYDDAVEMQHDGDLAPERIVAVLSDAAAGLDRSLKLRASPEAYSLRGRVRLEQMRLDDAEADFTAAGDREWRARLNALRLRFSAFSLGTPEQDRRDRERWARAAREDLAALGGSGRAIVDALTLALVEDDLEGALAAIRHAAEGRLDEDLLAEQGALELKLDRLDDAIASLTTALQMRPHFLRARLTRGIALRDAGRMREAEADFAAAVALAPDCPLAWFARANIRHLLGDFTGAEADLREALDLDPNLAAAWGNLGVARSAMGRYDGAIEALNRAIDLAPDWAEAHLNRGEAHRAAGRLRDAISDLDRAIDLQPELAQAWAARAFAYMALEEFDRARTDLDETVRLLPNNAFYLTERGRLRHLQGDVTGAIEDHTAALAAQPEFPQALQNRGAAYVDSGEWEEAEADFAALVRVQPDNAMGHCLRGDCLGVMQRWEEAEHEYDRAVDLQPEYPEALANRGIVRAQRGDNEGAAEDFDAALRCAPGDWPLQGRVEELLRAVGVEFR